MPFQLSPGVQVLEKDFTSVVPAVSASNGALCGPFTWGPIEDPIRISSENELVSLFGKPTSANYASWFTAANFLAYSTSLLVTRTDSTQAKNAVSTLSAGINASNVVIQDKGLEYANGTTITLTFSAPTLGGGVTAEGTATWDGDTLGAGSWEVTITEPGSGYILKADGTPDVTVTAPDRSETVAADAVFRVVSLNLGGLKIKNLDDYLLGFADETAVNGLLAAKFAGTKANGLRVVFIDYGNWDVTPQSVRSKFSARPNTSSFAALKGIVFDELHIAVYDNAEGTFSGSPNSLLETFEFMSKLSDAKLEDGTSNFYKNIINNNSKYLWHLRTPGSNIMSEFLTSNNIGGAAGEGTDGSYLVFGDVSSGSGMNGITFTASTKTISITDADKFSSISAFKGFFDNAPDKSTRQILVSGSLNNNFAFTVVSVTATLSGETVTGYDIVVAENVVDEAVSSYVSPVSIRSLIRFAWGISSEQTSQYAGDNYFPVLRDDDAFATGFASILRGGVDDLSVTSGQYQAAYGVLANTELYDVSLLPLANVGPSVAQWVVNNVAEVRKDCVVFISPNTATGIQTVGSVITATGDAAVTAIKDFKDALGVNSSYAVMDSGFKYMYDRYSDIYRWVPLSGDIAGLCARTDITTDPWYSPGGFNRGVIKNIIKLAFNPNQTQRDDLYINSVNPVVTFRGQGTILYGDKTLLARPSAFDRINVRRLFIVLEKAIAIASRSQLFEFNDAFTRAQFKNLVEPFLRDVQGRRGINEFRVVCDESNNTGEVIDRNEFAADIYIKPNRSINFITLSFIAARSSISFEEIGA